MDRQEASMKCCLLRGAKKAQKSDSDFPPALFCANRSLLGLRVTSRVKWHKASNLHSKILLMSVEPLGTTSTALIPDWLGLDVSGNTLLASKA